MDMQERTEQLKRLAAMAEPTLIEIATRTYDGTVGSAFAALVAMSEKRSAEQRHNEPLLEALMDAAIDIVEQVDAWEWLHEKECAIDPDPLRLAIESFTMEPFKDSVRKRYTENRGE